MTTSRASYIKSFSYTNTFDYLHLVEHCKCFYMLCRQKDYLPRINHIDTNQKTIHFEYIENAHSISKTLKFTGMSSITSRQRCVARQVYSIRKFLYDQRIVHGDLVPHNLIECNRKVYIIDCFPPLLLPRRLRYLNPELEDLGYLFAYLSSHPLRVLTEPWLLFRRMKLLRLTPIGHYKWSSLLRVTTILACEYFRIKSHSANPFRPAFKVVVSLLYLYLYLLYV